MIPPGKMIATIRKERELTQAELARRVHVTKQTISNYERLEREPDLDVLGLTVLGLCIINVF